MVTYLLSRAEGAAVALATLRHVVSESLCWAVCWIYPLWWFFILPISWREMVIIRLVVSASLVSDLKEYFDGEEVFGWRMGGLSN